MKSVLPQFMLLLLLVAACHKDEDEIVPVPPDSQSATTETTPPVAEDEVPPPVRTDSAFYEYGMHKDLPYRYLLPQDMDPQVMYPMLIFLHGMGERGKDNEEQLNIGGSFFLLDSTRDKYPAIIVYPQCPTNAFWFDSDIMELVKDLAETLQNAYPVDPKRISIGGFSMGAYGAFEITSRYPGFFEAALAISGDGDESKAALMAESRWRIFAGGHDDVVPSSKSKQIATAIERAGASVDFTLYPQADHHHTWVNTFSEPDLFDWLFRDSAAVLTKKDLDRDDYQGTAHPGTSSGSGAM